MRRGQRGTPRALCQSFAVALALVTIVGMLFNAAYLLHTGEPLEDAEDPSLGGPPVVAHAQPDAPASRSLGSVPTIERPAAPPPRNVWADDGDSGSAGGGATATVSMPPSLRFQPDAAAAGIDTTSVTGFVRSGGRLPILMLVGNRTDMVQRTLTSLLAVRGVRREAVFVMQDAQVASPSVEAVRRLLIDFGVRFSQNVDRFVSHARGRDEIGSERIAAHYKRSLSVMFNDVTTVR
jgi:hypothetical protein